MLWYLLSWFYSTPTPKEQQRLAERQLRQTGRKIDKELRQTENEEKKLQQEIKKLAKQGNPEGCKMLAKQLVQLRKQKQHIYAASANILNIGHQSKVVETNSKLADAISTSGKIISNMNKLMKPEDISATLNNFTMESTKSDISFENINDTFEDILSESGDEAESDYIISKVFDEIGIEVCQKMPNVPTPKKGKIGSNITDEELSAQLAKLQK